MAIKRIHVITLGCILMLAHGGDSQAQLRQVQSGVRIEGFNSPNRSTNGRFVVIFKNEAIASMANPVLRPRQSRFVAESEVKRARDAVRADSERLAQRL